MILEVFSILNDSMILQAQATNISLRLFFIKEETPCRVLFGPAAVWRTLGTWKIPSCTWLGHLAAGELHSIPAALPASAAQKIIFSKKDPARCRINIIHQIATGVTMAPDKKDKKRKGVYITIPFYCCLSY